MADASEVDRRNEKLAEEFLNLTNYMGNDRDLADALLSRLQREHRTLQATFWRVIQMVARKYKDFPSDLRNEAAVEFARKIDALDCPLPHI